MLIFAWKLSTQVAARKRAPTDRRVKEVAEGGPGAPQVAVSQRVFCDEREAARQHLLALGEPTAAQLIPLLEDGRRIFYSGSEEATIGNAYEYRIKDLAAFFIARLRNLPYAVRKTPVERDAEIARLRAAL